MFERDRLIAVNRRMVEVSATQSPSSCLRWSIASYVFLFLCLTIGCICLRNFTIERKSKKKKSKTKHSKESAAGDSTKAASSKQHKPSLETTATAEGEIMAQVLSTFSRLEQSRFEAFRRSTFQGDALSKYVAHLLIEKKHRSELGRRAPILSEVCAPGQAEEITIVVSTLAKAYAQRLVTAARRQQQSETSKSNSNNSNNNPNSTTPIQPHHILQAHREREQQGLDPGFFLQPAPSEVNVSVDQESTNKYDQLRLATLQAQENFEKEHGAHMEVVEDDDEEEHKIEGDDNGNEKSDWENLGIDIDKFCKKKQKNDDKTDTPNNKNDNKNTDVDVEMVFDNHDKAEPEKETEESKEKANEGKINDDKTETMNDESEPGKGDEETKEEGDKDQDNTEFEEKTESKGDKKEPEKDEATKGGEDDTRNKEDEKLETKDDTTDKDGDVVMATTDNGKDESSTNARTSEPK